MKNLSMKIKLLVIFLTIGLVPVVTVTFFNLRSAEGLLEARAYAQLEAVRALKRDQVATFFERRRGDMSALVNTISALRRESFSRLEGIRALKKVQIERHLEGIAREVSFLAEEAYVARLLDRLRGYAREREAQPGQTLPVDDARWRAIAGEADVSLGRFMRAFEFYDVFLISPEGRVLYTVAREPDLGADLSHGALKDSHLAALTREVMSTGALTFEDFQPYAPSRGAPAAFVGAPVRREGRLEGVLAVQISIDAINHIMLERAGLGVTGETYLVGPDKLMRSDSHLDPKHHTVVASFKDPHKGRVDTAPVTAALSGEEGMGVIIDYNGNPVLSAWTPLTIRGLRWALLAEIDVAEAFTPKTQDGRDFLAEYAKLYGYANLLLIDPDGFIFYSAAKREGEARGDVTRGPLSETHLAALFEGVMAQKSFQFEDFDLYAPGGGAPAAFLGEPVKHGGVVDAVVAVEISTEGLARFMQARGGMGETGETYLISADKRMRSDSFLDPEGHSVTASLRGTVEENGVDTEAARRALGGEEGVRLIEDYNDNPVLSAFTPIDVFGARWALLAEIDEAEINAPIRALLWAGLLVVLLTTLIIVAVGFTLARRIAHPLRAAAATFTSMAQGDLTVDLDYEGQDEIGQMSDAAGALVLRLRQSIGAMSESASSLASASEELSAIATQLNANAETTTGEAEAAQEASSAISEAVQQLAASGEELSTSVTEISHSVETASSVSRRAVELAQSADEAMRRLEDTSQQIGEMTGVINTIAEQTNLLALNATIEAARAGEAGKGFAVVANEVKQLAQETAKATQEVDARVTAIQAETRGTLGSIEEIVEIVKQVNALQGMIAVAVQEQAATTEEMARRITGSARNAAGISERMLKVVEVAQTSAVGARSTLDAANPIARMATELNALAAQFRVEPT